MSEPVRRWAEMGNNLKNKNGRTSTVGHLTIALKQASCCGNAYAYNLYSDSSN